MGAHDFTDTIWTAANLRAAYDQAVEQANMEYGHEPYNGTISTTEGVVRSPLYPNPVPETEIDWEKVNERIGNMDKWGACEAIPVLKCENAQTTGMGVFTAEVQVDTAAMFGPQKVMWAALLDAANKAFARQVRTGGFETTEWYGTEGRKVSTKGANVPEYRARLQRYKVLQTPKVTTVAPKEARETRYFIITVGQQSMPVWENGHPTQAAARAVLPTVMPKQHEGQAAEYEIISMTRRVGGVGLVSHRLDVGTKKTVTVQVECNVERVDTPGKVTGEPGWVFYGIAAS